MTILIGAGLIGLGMFAGAALLAYALLNTLVGPRW